MGGFLIFSSRYCGNTNFSQEIAVNLILALSEFTLPLLEAACEAAIQKPCDISTAFPILVRGTKKKYRLLKKKFLRELRFIRCGLPGLRSGLSERR